MKSLFRYKATFTVLAITTVLFTLFGTSCKKTKTLSVGGELRFSDDTLHFDTVFTAAGSFTRGILIYNPQNEAVVLSSVRTQNGASSYFHLNVDGFTGNNVANVKIAPHDSIYVYATVNIDPSDKLTPFLVTDQLIATLNGKDFSVPLTAYGQNAHYIIGDSINTTITWDTDKPYVVIHNFVVGPAGTLNIPRGCRVYMHQDAQFVVFNKMNVGQTPAGSKDSVVFQGDRLDRVYFGYIGYPGEWAGLWFVPASTGNISHTVIKNCGGGAAYHAYGIFPAAIRADSGANVTLDHSVVKNSISIGIFSFQGNVTATNCLVHTTGGQALAVSLGGNDSFTNCTFANYGTGQVSHASTGSVALLDYYWDGVSGDPVYYADLNVSMHNCLVYGSLDSEIVCDSTGSPAGTHARINMDHCLLKTGNVLYIEPFVQLNACLNKDPMFKNTANGDFHLMDGSPAKGAGNAAFTPADDVDGNARAGNDIGCY